MARLQRVADRCIGTQPMRNRAPRFTIAIDSGGAACESSGAEALPAAIPGSCGFDEPGRRACRLRTAGSNARARAASSVVDGADSPDARATSAPVWR
jgi:hypothetical protein